MKKVLAALQKVEITVIIVTFIVMTCAAFAQVVNRNIVHAGVSWFEELSRYCMIYMALLATELGIRDGSQIAITILVDQFKGVPRRILDILAKAAVVAYSLIVCVSSFSMMERQVATWQLSPGMRIPMLIPYAAVTLTFAIITLVQGAALIHMARSLVTGSVEGGTA